VKTTLGKVTVALAMVAMMAAPVSAQQTSGGSDQPLPPASAERAATGAPLRQSATPITFRAHVGGMFWGGGTGLVLGAGAGARPFTNAQIEIAGDLSYLRFEGSNGFMFSGNGLYHFETSDPRFSPYAGAGLGIVHFSGSTEARFQIAGGLEFNAEGPNPIRPEVRFIFTDRDTTTVLLVSIGFGRR